MTMLRLASSRHALAALAAACTAALGVAGAAVAADIGANDSTGKFAADGGVAFYQRMAQLGLRQAIITTRWTPSDPLALPDAGMLDLTVQAALAAGVRPVLAVYPYPPREIESGLATPQAFAAWIGNLARRYPQVTQFVVGNEPNQPAFHRPQFVDGKQASAAAFGPLLAAAYDALKGVDPGIRVVGVGLSPRGNDRPYAVSNVSTSPVRFLAALGRWYRKSGRTTPLMDGFSFHPYPNRATDPLERGYPWPNAGFANLARIKQALWDAFVGTPQPTTVNGLKLYLDEVGWQVDTQGLPGYVGVENVPVTDDATQAEIYTDLLEQAACDPDIAEVNFFGFYDDPLRTGFQSALHLPDGTPRPAADAVAAALGRPCTALAAPWAPTRSVVGATEPLVTRTGRTVTVDVNVGEGAIGRVCVQTGRVALPVMRTLLARSSTPGCVKSKLTWLTPNRLQVTVPPGRVTVGVRLTAEANGKRRAISSFVR